MTLTPRQKQILEYIDSCRQEDGTVPSLRDMAEHFGFRSANAARDHVQALCRKGVLQMDAGKARSLRIAGPLQDLRQRVMDVPIYGSIPAGFAEGRGQEPMGCVSVDIETAGIRPTARTFALQVQGDSMIGRHICDGDIVICEHGRTPRSGDVVAALIDNESTLKTFMRDRRRPYLKAENPNYPELIPADELVIQGVVVSVIRRFD
jgi:repressor LexA